MQLNLIVEHIEVALFTGDAKKDRDTSYRMLLYHSNGNYLAHQHWVGGGGVPTGEWIGSGTTYYSGPNTPNWRNDMGEWRAASGNIPLTLEHFRGGLLVIEIGSNPTDHWEVWAVVKAKLQGHQTIVDLSPETGGTQGVASDGHSTWPNRVSFPLSLVVP